MSFLNPQSFHAEARYQRVCINPDCDDPFGPFHAHHAVYQQHVRRLRPDLIWDPRNAVRLSLTCHGAKHSPGPYPEPAIAIKTIWLPDAVIEFAIEIMGDGRTINYLRRYYSDADADPRLVAIDRRAA